MATPEDAATSNSHSSSTAPKAQPSKRGACDRCRGQKLRCLRDDQSQDGSQAPCVRCFKAGATCSYGIAKRAGRPPASNVSHAHAPSPQQQRKGNRAEKTKENGRASRSVLNTNGHHLTSFFDRQTDGGRFRRGTDGSASGRLLQDSTLIIPNQESEEENETLETPPVEKLSPDPLHDKTSHLAGADLHFAAYSGSSNATLPWPDETLSAFYNNDAGQALGVEPFGPKYSWAFHAYQAQPMDIQMPAALAMSSDCQSKDMGTNGYGTPAQTYSTNAEVSGSSDEAMDLDFPFCERDRNTVAENEVGNGFDESTLSFNEIQHRRMQELSKLTMDLYAQLAANDPENDRQRASDTTATVFQGQLVGSVLRSSNTFLTLLTSFSTPDTSSSPPITRPPPTSPTNQDNSPCSSSYSRASPSASTSDQDESTTDDTGQDSRGKLPSGSFDDSQPPPPTDMTTVLQLLTCYLRIIHLHSIMHIKLLDYLLAFFPHTNQHAGSVPPVFPGMQVGGVSLDRFGPFQVKLLLQIGMHVLGEIELALGLPEEYMIGKRKRKKDGRGLLEASVSAGFVKRLMREEAWRGKKVEFVRERLRDLRRVLKGAIDFE
uniref:Zn(2)-C6 fungal-type domain-containing protein n=1 Tax=Cladonia uncialis subsp. uncialis TaxID=180999 RepID=A0A1Z1C459_CLAUC|nr:hypothetical protein [Cladonia uncialis subsp. uncialis]AUW31120.1 hypothetical protein [Cladonia uncialis subsp. uncialis]